MTTANESTKRKGPTQRGTDVLAILGIVAVVGTSLIAVYSKTTDARLMILSAACMWSIACMLGGGLCGFLFGIPRTLQHQREENLSTKADNANDKSTYAPNTNLEQISDWLTKILVGVGLVEIGTIRQFLGNLAANLSPAFGGTTLGKYFALATILTYALLGFLAGYLWTRLFFAEALTAADAASLAKEIQEIRHQSDLDARALSLTLRQLNPSTETPAPSQKELDDAVYEASTSIRAQIFYQAQAVRSENWEDFSTKLKMERSIPAFLALISADKDSEFHRNHAQLGYALKDSRKPKWQEAKEALTIAIERRGPWQKCGYCFYEFNRAICVIRLDDPLIKRQSAVEVRNAINDDLRAVFSNQKYYRLIDSEPEIRQWMQLNGVTSEDLKNTL